ncbi:MAG: hypothetical protein QM820_58545 [Minicystis sp.]
MRRSITAPSRRAASAALSLAALVYGSAGHADPLAQQAAAPCDPADPACAGATAQLDATAKLDAQAQLGVQAQVQACDPQDPACAAPNVAPTIALTAGCAPDDVQCQQAANPGALPCDPVDPACSDPDTAAALKAAIDRAVEVASFLATTICPPYVQECADDVAHRVNACALGDDACLDAVAQKALTEAHRDTMAAVCDDTSCVPGPSEGGDGPAWNVVSDPGCAACPTTCVQGWVVNTDPGGITNTVRGDVLFERAIDGVVGHLPWFYWTHSGVITSNDLGAPTLVRHTDMDIEAVPYDADESGLVSASAFGDSGYGLVTLNGAALQHGMPGIATSDVMSRFVAGYHHDPSQWQGAGVLHAGGTSAKQHDAQAVAAWEEAQPNGSIYYSVYSYEDQAAGWAGTHDHWTGAPVAARGSMCSGTIAIATNAIPLWGSLPVASVYDGSTNWVTGPDYLAPGAPWVTHDIGTQAAAHLVHDFAFHKIRDKIAEHSTFLSSSVMDSAANGVADQVTNCFAFPQASCHRMDNSWVWAGASLAVAPDHIQSASNSPWVNATEPAHILPRTTYITHTGRWYCPIPPPVRQDDLQVTRLEIDDGKPHWHVRLCPYPGPHGWLYRPCDMVVKEAHGEAG